MRIHSRQSGCVLGAILLFCGIGPALGQDGAYDDTFGNYLPGRSVYALFDDDIEEGYAVEILPDDGMIMAGFRIAMKLGPTGLLDEGFGNLAPEAPGGLSMEPYGQGQGPRMYIEAVQRQDDGKLLFAGSVPEPVGAGFRFAACRTSADGVLDPDYGDAGCTVYQVEDPSNSAVRAALLDDAGRLLMVARVEASFGQKMVVIRLDTDGHLDTSFGTNGKTVILRFEEIAPGNDNDEPHGMTLDASGRILVVGQSGPSGDANFAVARLDAEGHIDSGFGNGGVVLMDFNGQNETDVAMTVAVQRSGRIVVAGIADSSNAGFSAGCAFIGLTEDGALDTSFGSGGDTGRFVTYPFGNNQFTECNGIAMYPDGRFALVGYGRNAANGGVPGMDMVIIRFTARGDDYDATFGAGGYFFTGFDFGTGSNNNDRDDRLHAVALDSRRRLVAVGGAANNDGVAMVALRLTQDGLFANGFEPQ